MCAAAGHPVDPGGGKPDAEGVRADLQGEAVQQPSGQVAQLR